MSKKLSKQIFSVGFATLCEMAGKTPSRALIDAYYDQLCHLTGDQFGQAIQNVIGTMKFPRLPMPAEILEALHGKAEDRALLALEKVRQAKWRTKGGLLSVTFDDEIIHLVIRDWGEVCDIPEEKWPFFEKDFVREYVAYSRQKNRPRPEAILVGKLQRENEAAGHSAERLAEIGKEQLAITMGLKPVVMGDEKLALEWTTQVQGKKLLESKDSKSKTIDFDKIGKKL